MTPGPASLMVTELPRKRPTPMAPPRAIMVSWRCVSARLSSEGPAGEWAALEAIDAVGAAARLPAANQVTKYLSELANLLNRVVVDKRCAVDAGVEADAEAVHQSRGVHVAISNADAALGHGLRNNGGRDVWKPETESGNAFGEASRIVNTVDHGACRPQGFDHLAGKRGFVFADRAHGAGDGGSPRCGGCAFVFAVEVRAKSLEVIDGG